MILYRGKVIPSKDPLKAGFIRISHHLFGVEGQLIGPLMNTPGSLQLPDDNAEVVFARIDGEEGSKEWVWLGESFKPNAIRNVRPEEMDSSLGSTQTGMVANVNTGYLEDYSDDGIHTIYRINSPSKHHSIELMEQVNPSVDGEGPAQEFLGIKLKTQDGKGIFLDDGQGKGKDGIKLYLQEGEEDKNVIQMSKGGDENGVAPESLTIVMNNNVEITSSKGNIAIAVATGEGGITIQNLGTGPVEIDSGGEVSVSAIGDISVVSTQGDISVASTQGDVNVEAGDGEDDSIDATISTDWATKLSNVGASFATGDIEVPITSHPNVKINGKPAITK